MSPNNRHQRNASAARSVPDSGWRHCPFGQLRIRRCASLDRLLQVNDLKQASSNAVYTVRTDYPVSGKMAKKNTLSWSAVKTKLVDFDRAGLIGLVQQLYVASKDNQAFLHARFELGDDLLKPYKATIDRWLSPNVVKDQLTSVAQAKKAITDYQRANGQSAGLAELMVFYCERAADFCHAVGLQDESYFAALVRMFEQALKAVAALPEEARPALRHRLDEIRLVSHKLGYGIGDAMDQLLSRHGVDGSLHRN